MIEVEAVDLQAAQGDLFVRALGAFRWLFDVLPGRPGHVVWNWFVSVQDAAFLAAACRHAAARVTRSG